MDSDKARICVLYDIYGDLLPKSCADFIDMYYNDDLSLSEIAENVGISRQGVRSGIMHGIKILSEYESKLSLYEKYKCNNETVKEIKTELSSAALPDDKKEKIFSLLNKLAY
jgi:predicted DNA-binding protein YlxM (UPF0122 family)